MVILNAGNMRTYLLLLIALAGQCLVQGQITVKGRLINLPPNSEARLAWDSWVTDNWKQKDTLNLLANGSFEKTITLQPGQARLRVWSKPTSWMEFVVPQDQAGIVLDFGTFDFANLNGGPAALKDPENQAYAEMMLIVRDMKAVKDSLDKNLAPADGDGLAQRSRYQSYRMHLNEKCLLAAKSQKGTFTGDIVTRLLYQVIPEVDASHKGDAKWANLYMRQHALDQIPFADKRIMSHGGLMRALIQYQNDYFRSDTLDKKSFIDRVMARRSGTPEVDDWLFRFLWERSMSRKDDYSVSYIVASYAPTCPDDAGSLQSHLKSMVEAFQNCEIGKPGADIKVTNFEGKTVNLSSLINKGKLNLLMFWRSDCSHCREFEPILSALYERYKAQGLEVIAISLDQEAGNWKKFLAANPKSWINVTTTPEQRKVLNKNYPIPGTPTVIAMDNKGIILNRMLYRAGLDQYLEETLRDMKGPLK